MYDNLKLQKYLRSHPDLTLQEKGLALILSSYRNGKTGKCFPSQSKLAAESSTSREYINRLVRSLRKKGVISVEKMRVSNVRKRTVNNYVFLFDK